MKIRKQSDKAILTINRNDWIKIGQDAGFEIEPQDTEQLQPSTAPMPEPFNIEVRKYSTRTWGVYLNAELVCVTVYKKGAFAVENLLQELWGRIKAAERQIGID